MNIIKCAFVYNTAINPRQSYARYQLPNGQVQRATAKFSF